MNLKGWIIIGLFGCISNTCIAFSELEMRPAYYKNQTNSMRMTFPNDSFPRYVSKTPLLTNKDFISIKIVNGGIAFGRVLEVKISRSALTKYNKVANQKNMPSLGIFIKGKAVSLLQGMHPLEEPELWLTGLSASEMSYLVKLFKK